MNYDRYASHPCYSEAFPLDGIDGQLSGQLALLCRIKPGAYQVGQQTIGAKQRIDELYLNERIEWYTKSSVAIMATAILVRIMKTEKFEKQREMAHHDVGDAVNRMPMGMMENEMVMNNNDAYPESSDSESDSSSDSRYMTRTAKE